MEESQLIINSSLTADDRRRSVNVEGGASGGGSACEPISSGIGLG
jgi:hypothetical protein